MAKTCCPHLLIKRFLLGSLSFYQRFISPFLGQRCRFYPSCSAYAKEAINQHGIIKGIALATHRLLRCHPLSKGGFDPIPEKTKSEPFSKERRHGAAIPRILM